MLKSPSQKKHQQGTNSFQSRVKMSGFKYTLRSNAIRVQMHDCLPSTPLNLRLRPAPPPSPSAPSPLHPLLAGTAPVAFSIFVYRALVQRHKLQWTWCVPRCSFYFPFTVSNKIQSRHSMFWSTIEALSVPKYNRGTKRSEDPLFSLWNSFSHGQYFSGGVWKLQKNFTA